MCESMGYCQWLKRQQSEEVKACRGAPLRCFRVRNSTGVEGARQRRSADTPAGQRDSEQSKQRQRSATMSLPQPHTDRGFLPPNA